MLVYSKRYAYFLLLLGSAEAAVKGPYPKGVPGSGYGCRNRCRKNADVFYTIEGRLQEYRVPGTADNPESSLYEATTPVGAEQSMFTRSWVGNVGKSSPFCFGYNGRSGPIGPCLQVRAGQLLKIRVVNRMNDGMKELQQRPLNKQDYFVRSETLPINYGPLPERPSDMNIENEENIPGADLIAGYDTTNLHTHGLHVATHMFYPQGTGDPDAQWIDIVPPKVNRTQSCFCYVFQIAENHPQGAYWYHVHRHGSSAVQAWQGMAGLLLVTGDHDPITELEAQGVTRHIPFPLWQWKADSTKTLAHLGKPNTFIETDAMYHSFVPTPTMINSFDTYLVGNEFQPTFEMCVGETVNVIFLHAAASTGTGIYLWNEIDELTPFWRYASDGVSYDRAYEKRDLVIFSGMREGLLFQFSEPGLYRLRQAIFTGPLFIGTPESTNAFFSVTDDPYKCGPIEPIDMTSLVFTPGVEAGDVQPEEILTEKDIAFGVRFDADEAPYPGFTIDGELFEIDHISQVETVEFAASWVFTSNQAAFHPVHVHINPVQIKEINMGNPSLATGTIFNPDGAYAGDQIDISESVLHSMMEPENQWRDVVIIPATGMVNVWHRFGTKGPGEIAWAGKSVFHCHFLDHEDEGMMSNFIVERRNPGDSNGGRGN